jgi:hypothetical protein
MVGLTIEYKDRGVDDRQHPKRHSSGFRTLGPHGLTTRQPVTSESGCGLASRTSYVYFYSLRSGEH